MQYVVNVQGKNPDEDPRSLRARVANRDKAVLRDTYILIECEKGPSQSLKMGYTVIYPTGTTTGHSHDEEEVYFVISGEGIMQVGNDKYEIRPGDALYVPPGEFHTTYQKGNIPLTVVWVTGKVVKEARD
ncbi:RmlC-like jelly roll fold [Moorella glycerini]|uniref:Cupin domain protein n=1 Tax=Neomoorella stamsii TaxID=1266720 RepID=A0A9X7J519_9FIRM|nr:MULTISPECIES: cupin domain-containing protein [Moorella]PRR76445.1 Cupin domain protein [Moorella stamsii]CEP66986.1 RmlC-like jelly roll fold [Moorella glycerini]